jgi:Uncharacterized protein involved in outer membrane biogenesis
MEKLVRYLKRTKKTVIVVILILVVIRIFLPVGIKYGINWYLDKKLDTYQGRIEDFDLALYRGAYQIEGLKIWKKEVGEDLPLIYVKRIDLSLAWRALFKGHLLGDLDIQEPVIALVDSKEKEKKQTGVGEDWKAIVGRLIPIEIESLTIDNGEVKMVNRDFKVPLEILVDQIDVKANNIRNTESKKATLPSDVIASARLQKDATAHLKGKMDAVSKIPAFDLSFTLEKLDLTKFNKVLITYVPFTFTSGRFSMYSEIATKNNQVIGYVKPFLEDADIIDAKESFISGKHVLIEIGVAVTNLVVRDFKQKNAATKIEFKGNVKDPEIDKWGAFWTAIKNGFGDALKERLDNSISIKDVPKKK